MALLFAVLQPAAFVIFQHAMFTAELALTERTVADDPLSLVFAVLESTADLLRSAATYGKGDVDSGIWW